MFHTTLFKWVTASLITLTLIGGWSRTSFSRADGNTWYVATDGSDNAGDGSETNPFSTIQHGMDIANLGSTA